MSPCEGRDPNLVGAVHSRIDQTLAQLIARDEIETFVVSVTFSFERDAQWLGAHGLLDTGDEIVGALPREQLLALAEHSEVECIRAAREMLDSMAPDGELIDPLVRSAKLDTALVRALRIAPDGMHDVTVLFRGAVDGDMLNRTELYAIGRMPGGGLLATGVLGASTIEELAERNEVVAIESSKTDKLLNDQESNETEGK